MPMMFFRMTANFAEMPDESAVWDFSGYSGENAVTAENEQSEGYNGLEIHLGNGDSVSEKGIDWSTAGGKASDSTTTVTNNRYIRYTAEKSGTLTITFRGNRYDSSSKAPRLYVSCGDDLSCTTKNSNTSQTETNQSATATGAGRDAVLKATVTEGNTYFIWAYYYYNLNAEFNISQITFEAAAEQNDVKKIKK